MPVQMLELLPAELTADDVENISQRLTRSDAPTLELDLRHFKQSLPLADGRLLSLCALARRNGIAVEVKIASSNTRGSLGQRYSKIFGASSAGLILGQSAERIQDDDGADLTEEVRALQSDALKHPHYRLPRGVMGAGGDLALPAIDLYGAPPPAELLHEEASSLFADRFRRLVITSFNLPFREATDTPGTRPLVVGRTESAALDRIAQFAEETFQNATEHGSRDYNGRKVDGIRVVILRRTILEKRSVTEFASDTDSALTSYFNALTEDGCDLSDSSLIEITVGDCGIGIPGRLTGSREAYSGPLADEHRLVESALRDDVTSKSPIDSGAGLGLDKAVRAVWYLKGMVLFRTGRSCLFSHYRLQSDKPPFKLQQASAREYCYVPGTSVSMLFLYDNNTDRPASARGR